MSVDKRGVGGCGGINEGMDVELENLGGMDRGRLFQNPSRFVGNVEIKIVRGWLSH